MCATCEQTATEVRSQKGAIRRMDSTMKAVVDEVGKASSNSHNSAANSAETKALLELYIKTCEVRYQEGKDEHESMWAKIDKLMRFYHLTLGGGTAILAVAAIIWALLKWVF